MLTRIRLLWGGTLMLVAAGAVAVLVLRDPPPGDQARADLRDPANFVSTTKAVDTLLAVADLAAAERARCGAERRECDSWAAAAAYARVGAATVLQCTAPGREQVRRQVADYIDAVATAARTQGDIPQPNRPTSCR